MPLLMKRSAIHRKEIAFLADDKGAALQIDDDKGDQHHANAQQLIPGQMILPDHGGKEQGDQHAAGIGEQALQRVRAGARGADCAEIENEENQAVAQDKRPGDGGSIELKARTDGKRERARDQPVNAGKYRRGGCGRAGVGLGIELAEKALAGKRGDGENP